MTLTTAEFVERLSAVGDAAATTVTEHIGYYDELLLHVLMGDMWRLALEAHGHGDAALLHSLLEVLALGLVEGEEDVKNAIATSFVWGTNADDGSEPAFIDEWPAPLRAELERQRPTS